MRRLLYPCDDRTGFALAILQANDGDFHISLQLVPDDYMHEAGIGSRAELSDRLMKGLVPVSVASVRIRTPMIGGGQYEALWHAIAKLFTTDAGRVEHG